MKINIEFNLDNEDDFESYEIFYASKNMRHFIDYIIKDLKGELTEELTESNQYNKNKKLLDIIFKKIDKRLKEEKININYLWDYYENYN